MAGLPKYDKPEDAPWCTERLHRLMEAPVICEFRRDNEWVDEFHRHVGVGIVYCLHGKGTYSFGNHTFPIFPGNLLYFDSRVAHRPVVRGRFVRWNVIFLEDQLQPWSNTVEPPAVSLLGDDDFRLFEIPRERASRFERLFTLDFSGMSSAEADSPLAG